MSAHRIPDEVRRAIETVYRADPTLTAREVLDRLWDADVPRRHIPCTGAVRRVIGYTRGRSP